ncbi:MAG: DUF6020 family protein [Lachnospiraceae bacterium]|nr:DUF6020 family protein [Lachnospiraceae bacterium]
MKQVLLQHKKKLLLFLILAAPASMGLLSNIGLSASLYADPGISGDKVAIWNYFIRVFSYDKLTSILLMLAICALYLYLFCNRQWKKKDFIAAGIFSLIFSLIQTIGNSFAASDGWNELTLSWVLAFRGILYFWGWIMVSFGITLWLFMLSDRILQPVIPGSKNPESTTSADGRKETLRLALILFLCWLPYLILLFPGTNNGDTIYQVSEFFGNFSHQGLHSMSAWGKNADAIHNHHPYMTTVLFGSFVKLGSILSGKRNATIGIALYSLVQTFALSFVIACWISYLKKEGLSEKLAKLTFWFCALFPGFPLIGVCMIKDSPFCIFILWGALLLLQIVRSKGEVLRRPSFVLSLTLSSLLISMTKSQGIYMVMIMLPVCLIYLRKKWLPICCGFLLPVLFMKMLWLPVILPALNVAPAGHQELIGPIMQQTARYVIEHGDEITQEEHDAINGIMKYKKIIKKYDPQLSDPIKKLYRSKSASDNLPAYYKTWFSMFFKHPRSYIDATINTCYPFFHLTSSRGIYKFYWENDDFAAKKENGYYSENAFPFACFALECLLKALQTVPGISLFFTMSAYTWFFFLLAILLIRSKKGAFLLPLCYVFLSIMVYLIAPAASGRYAWTAMVMFPFATSLLFLPGERVAAEGSEG